MSNTLRVLSLEVALMYAKKYGSKSEAERLISEAAPWVKKLKVVDPANVNLWLFYDAIGDKRLAEEVCASDFGKYHCEYILCHCLHKGDYPEAIETFSRIVSGKALTKHLQLNQAHLVRGLPNGKARAKALLQDLSFESAYLSRLYLYGLALVCEENELEMHAARIAAKYKNDVYATEELWRGAQCIRYLAGEFDDITLLAKGNNHMYPMSLMHCSIAFKSISQEDWEKARKHFRLAVETDTFGSSDFEIARAYLHRMQDESWPEWRIEN